MEDRDRDRRLDELVAIIELGPKTEENLRLSSSIDAWYEGRGRRGRGD